MNGITIYHWIVITLNVIVLAFMYILIGIKYSSLPDEICSHYNFKGECDNHSGKGIVFLLPIVSTILSIFLSLMCLLPTKYWKVNTGVESIELPEEIKGEVKSIVCLFCVLDSLIIAIFMAYVLNCMIFSWSVSTIFLIIFIISLIFMVFWLLYAIYSKINQFLHN